MRVVVAGTFGPLHDGHRALFRRALAHGDEGVVVSLTSDREAQRTRDRPVESFESRYRTVRSELRRLNTDDREIEIKRAHDEYGITTTDPDLDGIVVSEGTELEEIDRRRKARGLDSLTPIVVPYVDAADGERISSTRIVEGAIDEHGAEIV